jgi:hypothetical protein
MHPVDSLTLKIQSFLLNAGIQVDPSIPQTRALATYFADTYGVEMMAFLEQEWVSEQIERDLEDGAFSDLRTGSRRPG